MFLRFVVVFPRAAFALSALAGSTLLASVMAKKPTREEQARMCTRKRRYATAADALDAALLRGVERTSQAYRCPLCQRWHLTTTRPSR